MRTLKEEKVAIGKSLRQKGVELDEIVDKKWRHDQVMKKLAGVLGMSEAELMNKIEAAEQQWEEEQRHEARIIENTKFEQAEQLQLEGFPANNYIYCIEPATGDPNSFDVGTYGMIILFFSPK